MAAKKQKDKLSWGDDVKEQARFLLEALLAAAEGDLPDNCNYPKMKWEGESNVLIIETPNIDLKKLMEYNGYKFETAKTDQYEIPQALRDTISRLKILEILKAPNQPGKIILHYRLELCSRNRKENLTKFEEIWKQFKAEREKTQATISRKITPNKTKVIPEICPYKGLSAFTKDDSSFFFGREEFTKTLVDAVK